MPAKIPTDAIDERLQSLIAPVHPAVAALRDPAKYRVVPAVPIFDEHAPKPKKLTDGTTRTIGATRADLDEMARNSNAEVLAGRAPRVHLGHFGIQHFDADESSQPRHVGALHGFRVASLAGVPTLMADMSIRHADVDESASYPFPSIERAGHAEPGKQRVRSVALLRRQPDRDALPAINYAATPGGVAGPLHSAERLARIDRMTRERAAAQAAARAHPPAAPTVADHRAELRQLADFASRNRITDPAEARRRFDAERAAGTLNYGAGHPPRPADPAAEAKRISAAIIEHATRRQIRDPRAARESYFRANPEDAAILRYSREEDVQTSMAAEMGMPAPSNATANLLDPSRNARDMLAPLPAPPLGPPGGVVVPGSRSDGLSQFERTDRTPHWSIPNGGPGLKNVLESRSFRMAVRSYSTATGTYLAQEAGDKLVEEIRAGLVGWDGQGQLLFPKVPTGPWAPGDRPSPTPEAYWKSRRAEFWKKKAAEEKQARREENERSDREADLARRSRQASPPVV